MTAARAHGMRIGTRAPVNAVRAKWPPPALLGCRHIAHSTQIHGMRHHRRSLRLRRSDYRKAGAYWITICTKGRQPLLGSLDAEGVRLSPLGEIVQEEWLRATALRPDVVMDAFGVMPDHFHGILWIVGDPPNWTQRVTGFRRGKGALGTVIAGFKEATTSRIRLLQSDPALDVWQRSYHERVVREEARLLRLRRFVAENPARAWARATAR